MSEPRPAVRFDIPAGTPKRSCLSCGAAIFFLVMPSGRKMPVDPDGTSHFATCEHAASHRKVPRRG